MTRSAEIRAVLRDGKRIRLDSMEIRAMPSTLERTRVAIIIPRHRQTIVARNRLKRRVREIVRIDMLPSLRGSSLDLVVRASPAAYRRTFEQLQAELRGGLSRVGA